MAQPLDAKTWENAPDGDWLRAWAARNVSGGSEERVALVAIASVLDDYPRVRKLAEQPREADAAPVPNPPMEASLASIASSLRTLLERKT